MIKAIKMWVLGFKPYKSAFYSLNRRETEKYLSDMVINLAKEIGNITPLRLILEKDKFFTKREDLWEVQYWLMDIIEDYQEQLDDEEMFFEEAGISVYNGPEGHVHPADSNMCPDPNVPTCVKSYQE